ncbi:MAG: GNAT family N-acetyltransferase [Candidatus Bathyarchaeota archaeon]|nr:GNAT family N-acetyltransferase [Candidatus Bathyarchaeota archaeon]MDH5687929.1 GNAT family N-acetyltransferase [Candidatus Bathyarchaeota archaeon]
MALAEEFIPSEADAERRSSVLRQSLKELDYELLVADANGKVIGFIDQWIINDFVHGGKLAYIQNLYVSRNYRMKGIGGRLLQEMVKRAKDEAVIEIHVSTEFDNKGAIEFYRKQGFPKEHLQFEKEL